MEWFREDRWEVKKGLEGGLVNHTSDYEGGRRREEMVWQSGMRVPRLFCSPASSLGLSAPHSPRRSVSRALTVAVPVLASLWLPKTCTCCNAQVLLARPVVADISCASFVRKRDETRPEASCHLRLAGADRGARPP